MNRTQGFILALFLALFSTDVLAQTCVAAPDCAAMGYTQTVEECAGKNFVRCFYNTDMVYCGGGLCVYTSTTKPANCSVADSCVRDGVTYYSDECITCDVGYEVDSNGICKNTCDYTRTSLSSRCNDADSCIRDNITYYSDICTSCKSPYSLNSSGGCSCPDTSVEASYGCSQCCEGVCTSASVCNSSHKNYCSTHRTCHNFCCNAQNCAARPEIFDGKGNTQKIIAQMGANALAATACNQFYPPLLSPSDTTFGKGKWYLPAIGELMKINGIEPDCVLDGAEITGHAEEDKSFAAIERGIYYAGGARWLANHVRLFSSTEGGDDGYVWYVNVYDFHNQDDDGGREYSLKGSAFEVRCFTTLEGLDPVGGEEIEIGYIVYSDKTWSYNELEADKIPVGVVTDIHGEDVTIVNLQELTFSSARALGNFDASNPYGGSVGYTGWEYSTNYSYTDVTALANYSAEDLMTEIKDYPYW